MRSYSVLATCTAGLAILALSACDQSLHTSTAERVLPSAADPTVFTRSYGLTESPDGTLRVFAKENSDKTGLFLMQRTVVGWSSPEPLDLPHRETLTTPSFSPADGRLYYSSDQEAPTRLGRKDLNLWSVAFERGVPGVPEILPDVINTGANETSPAMDARGRLFFSSNHSRAGGGGYDIMMAARDDAGVWQVSNMPDGINDRRADDHLAVTADGRLLFFYSHRTPKYGQVDIWVTRFSSDEKWSTPENLGPVVNTDAIEYGAGLSSDGATLFFSRDGALMHIPLEAALDGIGQTPDGASD